MFRSCKGIGGFDILKKGNFLVIKQKYIFNKFIYRLGSGLFKTLKSGDTPPKFLNVSSKLEGIEKTRHSAYGIFYFPIMYTPP